MSTAGFVLACALDLLGRSPAHLPPIVLVDQRPPDASEHAIGFVRTGDRTIYLVTSAPAFQVAIEAQDGSRTCRGLESLRYIASVIVHEKWHLERGGNEEAAYAAQLTELQRLGSGPGRWPYVMVLKAMKRTVAAESERIRLARRQLALSR
jgi:hypothetical protein